VSLALGHDGFSSGHSDLYFGPELAWYAASPLVVEGGVRVNISNPGQATGARIHAAFTVGPPEQSHWVARGEWGNEAYQYLGGNAALVNFDSRDLALSRYSYLAVDHGYTLGLEYYANPYYRRIGLTAAYFFGL